MIGSAQRRRDSAYAGCLAFVLAVGVLGVLLLNMSMQQQARRMAQEHQRVTALASRAQTLQLGLDLTTSPEVLAAKARLLHLRPARTVRYVGVAAARTVGAREKRRLSGRKRGAGRDHGG